ncbi:unnamed protein product, partial [Trichogramma brassicae]
MASHCCVVPHHCIGRLDSKNTLSIGGAIIDIGGSFILSVNFLTFTTLDLNYIDDLGCTHFHVACEYSLEDVVQKFLELGQDPNILVQETGNSPLYLALRHNYGEKVSRMLLKHGAGPSLANKDGRTPLHVLGKNYWNSPDMEMIFELKKKLKPGQVDARDKLGNTPLHLTVSTLSSNANHVVRALLEIGANPNVANDEGLTPMHILCKSCPCYYYLRDVLLETSNEMKQPVQLDARDKLGNTPLHLAALRSLVDHLIWLLSNGADPNAVNEEGLTPLHIIVKTGDSSYARNFFKENKELNQLVQVDARDKLGRTPLQLAVANLLPDMTDTHILFTLHTILSSQIKICTLFIYVTNNPLHDAALIFDHGARGPATSQSIRLLKTFKSLIFVEKDESVISEYSLRYRKLSNRLLRLNYMSASIT